MSKRGWTCWVAMAAVMLAFATVGQEAEQEVDSITLAAGSDIFTTPGGGGTTLDLSQYPVEDIFGDEVTPTLVTLSGKPIGGLGKTDTVVQRLEDVTLSALNEPTDAAIELTGLSLKGVVQSGGDSWNLVVTVSSAVPSGGTLAVTRTAADGGYFDATIDVYPKLRFRNQRTGEEIEIDCGEVGCNAITLSSENAPWVIATRGGFSPGQAGVPNIGSGTSFDGDGDGEADDEYTKSNFHPGFEPHTYRPVPVSHDHPPVAQHLQNPNTQCKTVVVVATASSTGGARVADAATAQPALCAVIAEPVPTDEPVVPVAH